MSAAEKLTSSELPQVQPDAGKDFLELLLSGEFADLSNERMAALGGTRDDLKTALEYQAPLPGEPQEVHRTPIQHLQMVAWRRTPLPTDVEPVY
jgi:hypothetical protein